MESDSEKVPPWEKVNNDKEHRPRGGGERDAAHSLSPLLLLPAKFISSRFFPVLLFSLPPPKISLGFFLNVGSPKSPPASYAAASSFFSSFFEGGGGAATRQRSHHLPSPPNFSEHLMRKKEKGEGEREIPEISARVRVSKECKPFSISPSLLQFTILFGQKMGG